MTEAIIEADLYILRHNMRTFTQAALPVLSCHNMLICL
jgi:hypothetical protein